MKQLLAGTIVSVLLLAAAAGDSIAGAWTAGKLDITVGYIVSPAWGLEASYTPALYGQNTAAGATYSLAVFYKTP